MSFAITADFPLGTYRGGVGEGELDTFPSPARLHAALLSAAAQGLHADDRGPDEGLMPDRLSLDTLHWMEEHPPEGLAIPHHHRNTPDAMAFRDLALLKQKKQGIKKTPKQDHGNVALGGTFMWVWSEEPPGPVFDRLSDLCLDVPYLGKADSPVRLHAICGEQATQRKPTHKRDEAPKLGATRPSDVDLPTPRPGRSEALMQHHALLRGKKAPSLAADKATTDESELRFPVLESHMRQERFQPVERVDPPATGSPWPLAWVLPIQDSARFLVPQENRVRWCVAAHRALIGLHGDGAPSVLTGNYGLDRRAPANRVAIQLVDRHVKMSEAVLKAMGQSEQAFVIAVPDDCPEPDQVALARVVPRLTHVRQDRRHELRITQSAQGPTLIESARFWAPTPHQGAVRLWRSAPTVAESRRLQDEKWKLRDAVGYSLGLVLRDYFPEFHALGREERIRALSSWVLEESKAEVLRTRRVASTHPERYVHRVQPGVLVDPFTTALTFGELPLLETAFLAIGQPRHLGGGLLYPIDLEKEDFEFWRNS